MAKSPATYITLTSRWRHGDVTTVSSDIHVAAKSRPKGFQVSFGAKRRSVFEYKRPQHIINMLVFAPSVKIAANKRQCKCSVLLQFVLHHPRSAIAPPRALTSKASVHSAAQQMDDHCYNSCMAPNSCVSFRISMDTWEASCRYRHLDKPKMLLASTKL